MHGIHTDSTFNSLLLLFLYKRLQKKTKLFLMVKLLVIIVIKLHVTHSYFKETTCRDTIITNYNLKVSFQ